MRKLKRGVEEDDLGQQKSYLQKLAEQRDEKRRRQKYRSKKVYISNKSIKEVCVCVCVCVCMCVCVCVRVCVHVL